MGFENYLTVINLAIGIFNIVQLVIIRRKKAEILLVSKNLGKIMQRLLLRRL